MATFTNHVTLHGTANGTTSHTVDPSSGTVLAGSTFTPTAGRLLVVITYGSVTSTTPSGWTLEASAVNSGGLYIWSRTAAGGDTFSTTHNGSNYEVAFTILEFPSGSTWVNDVVATSTTASGANPNLTGLTGTNWVGGAKGLNTNAAVSGAWTSPVVELSDANQTAAVTDGFWLTVGYVEDHATSSFQPTCTRTGGAGSSESATFAVNVATSGSAITGTLSASAPAITVGPPTASITGTVDVPTYAGDVAASAPTVTVGPPSASISGTVTTPSATGDLAADAPAVTVGPPTVAMSGTVTAPTYAGDLAASTAALTVGPPTVAMSGTVTAPGANQVIASTPTIVIGPLTSNIAGTITAPVYAGAVAASTPAVVVGPTDLAMSGTVTTPTITGTLAASLPTITVGPLLAQIFDSSIPPLPTTGVSLTVSTGTRGLTVTTEARDLEVST